MIFLIIFIVVSGGVSAEGSGGDELGGELHCYLGIIAIALVVLSLGFGLLTSGRVGRIKRLKTVPLHLFFSILISVFLSGQFIYGLVKANWLIIMNYHSYIGFPTIIVAWLATILSPCILKKITRRKVSSEIHAILALLLLILVIAQVLNGYLFLEG